MWQLLSLVGIVGALRTDFDFIRGKCSCDYADAGPNFLPNDTIWNREDNLTRMPFQCPRRKLRNKYAVMKYIEEVEEEVRRNCNVADNCRRIGRRRNHDKLTPESEFDYIVVGSGAAGGVIAGRLSTQAQNWNKTVLLLEAGDVDPILSRVPAFYKYFRYHNDTDWNYRTEFDSTYCKMSYGRCRLNHGKSLGGSTIFNDMIYQRGHRHDCDAWFRSFGRKFRTCKDFEKFYFRFEHNLDTKKDDYYSLYGTDGPMPLQRFPHQTVIIQKFLKGVASAGFRPLSDLVNPNDLTGGLGVATSFQANGQRYTPARAYLHPAFQNLLIVLKAHVTKVLFEGNRAYAVQYALDDNWDDLRTVKARHEIILCAGVFNTPKILMLSGIGPKDELEKFNITVIKNYPIGKALKFHYGFRMRYSIGYAADHMRQWAWNQKFSHFWKLWFFLWPNAMIYLAPTAKWLSYYWVDLLDEENLENYLDKGEGALGSNGLAQLVGMFTTNFTIDKTRPDIQVIFEGMQADCSRTKKQNMTLPFKDYYPKEKGDRAFNTSIYRIINYTTNWYRWYRGKRMRINGDLHTVHSRNIDVFIHLLNPRSTGKMTLKSSHPKDPPLIYPNFFESTDDMQMLYQGARFVDNIMLSKGLHDLHLEMPVDYWRICAFSEYYGSHHIYDKYYSPWGFYFSIYYRDLNITFIRCLVRQYTVARYHQQGTVPMGAALNERYEVKDILGLRVVDGSIISGPISGSPQGTIMMFAESAVDIILNDYNIPNIEKIKFPPEISSTSTTKKPDIFTTTTESEYGRL